PNQVVFPEPGRPIARTTTPLGTCAERSTPGGADGVSGCVSTSRRPPPAGIGHSGRCACCRCAGPAGLGSCRRCEAAGDSSGYKGTNGAGWLDGSCWPIFPVDSERLGSRLERLL